jgi:hypothetical protein
MGLRGGSLAGMRTRFKPASEVSTKREMGSGIPMA